MWTPFNVSLPKTGILECKFLTKNPRTSMLSTTRPKSPGMCNQKISKAKTRIFPNDIKHGNGDGLAWQINSSVGLKHSGLNSPEATNTFQLWLFIGSENEDFLTTCHISDRKQTVCSSRGSWRAGAGRDQRIPSVVRHTAVTLGRSHYNWTENIHKHTYSLTALIRKGGN